MDGIIKSIESLNITITKSTQNLKKLKSQKKAYEARLVSLMEKNDLKSYKEYKLDKLKPKEPVIKKKAKEKESVAKQILRESGLHNSDEIWTKIKESQKPIKQSEVIKEKTYGEVIYE